MDYTDLNEACSKDSFHLPRIYQIVNDNPGCLLGISSNTHASARRGKNSLHYPALAVLLQCDAIWLKECQGNVSEVSDQDVQAATQTNHGGLH